MAIDTALKRRSVSGYTAPAVMLPTADGAIGQADRSMLAWLYAGVFTPVTPSIPENPVLAASRELIHTAAPRAWATRADNRQVVGEVTDREYEHTVTPRDRINS